MTPVSFMAVSIVVGVLSFLCRQCQ